jgi:hypothetical protein
MVAISVTVCVVDTRTVDVDVAVPLVKLVLLLSV